MVENDVANANYFSSPFSIWIDLMKNKPKNDHFLACPFIKRDEKKRKRNLRVDDEYCPRIAPRSFLAPQPTKHVIDLSETISCWNFNSWSINCVDNSFVASDPINFSRFISINIERIDFHCWRQLSPVLIFSRQRMTWVHVKRVTVDVNWWATTLQLVYFSDYFIGQRQQEDHSMN